MGLVEIPVPAVLGEAWWGGGSDGSFIKEDIWSDDNSELECFIEPGAKPQVTKPSRVSK